MKLLFFTLLLLLTSNGLEKEGKNEYPIQPLPLNEVEITGGFWAPILKTSREVTLPHILKFCEETGRIENFSVAAGISQGTHMGERYNDTDVFKAIEGAAYHLKSQENDALENYIDSVISLISAAQEMDGYLYTPRSIGPDTKVPGAGKARWEDVWISHELYNAGHLYEAAVAYYEATGKRILLDVALKNADLVISVFNEDGLQLAPGHQEIEIGLVKLYKVTGEQKYLDQALFFLNQRGKSIYREAEPEGSRFEIYNNPSYLQYHLPVRDQKEAVGHAVRAMYMYSGMTDVGYLCNDPVLLNSTDSIWNDIVTSKIYLTGGVGASHIGEAFSEPFSLPNGTAYCETCAAAGNLFWNYRKFSITSDTKFLDLFEVVLYNGFLSGVSLGGDRFFYPNPLESDGNYERSEWFGVACCPGNIARVIPALPGYIYSKSKNDIYVNLFVGSKAVTEIDGVRCRIEQNTDYPWDGKITLVINPDIPLWMRLKIRIPGWHSEYFLPGGLYSYTEPDTSLIRIYVNGHMEHEIVHGMAVIDRIWDKNDTIKFTLPVSPHFVKADPEIEEDRGKLAVVMGPLVYTAEGTDNGGTVRNIKISREDQLRSMHISGLLNGISVIESDQFRLIPYYSWANRGKSDMSVWLTGTGF